MREERRMVGLGEGVRGEGVGEGEAVEYARRKRGRRRGRRRDIVEGRRRLGGWVVG